MMRNVQSSPLCCQSYMNQEAAPQWLEVPGTVNIVVTAQQYKTNVTIGGTTTFMF